MSKKKKNSYKNVQSSFIHNNPKLEATQVAVSRRMINKQVVHSFNGITLNKKRNEPTHATM